MSAACASSLKLSRITAAASISLVAFLAPDGRTLPASRLAFLFNAWDTPARLPWMYLGSDPVHPRNSRVADAKNQRYWAE